MKNEVLFSIKYLMWDDFLVIELYFQFSFQFLQFIRLILNLSIDIFNMII